LGRRTFVIFVGVLGYVQVHRRLLKSIDDRRDRIKLELDEARRLKAEAQALFATYQRKLQEAEHEAQAIIAAPRPKPSGLLRGRNEDPRVRRAAHEGWPKARFRRPKRRRSPTCARLPQRLPLPPPNGFLTHAVKGKVADDSIVKGIADLKGKLN
jgi:F-type H+-transporting ATPase subunit b